MPESASLGFWYKLARRHLDDADARILCESAFNVTYGELIADAKSTVTTDQTNKLKSYVARRCEGEPIAYIVRSQGFWRHEFEVSPATLIPRPETETLVELVIPSIASDTPVLDLGTGCGAIGLSIGSATNARVTLVDASREALKIAKKNAKRFNLDVMIYESNWYESVDATFNCIVSNPPYIATKDPHLQRGDLRFEPLTALDGGQDGLTALREVIEGAPARLNPNGHLAVEHGSDQGTSVADLFRANGFCDIGLVKDLSGQSRVTHGYLP